MEFLDGVLSPSDTHAMVDRMEAHFKLHGFGPMAIESRETEALIGSIGPAVVKFEIPFETHCSPCVEIGWRLAFLYRF